MRYDRYNLGSSAYKQVIFRQSHPDKPLTRIPKPARIGFCSRSFHSAHFESTSSQLGTSGERFRPVLAILRRNHRRNQIAPARLDWRSGLKGWRNPAKHRLCPFQFPKYRLKKNHTVSLCARKLLGQARSALAQRRSSGSVARRPERAAANFRA